jgi:S1-C subfamily serine protease
VVQLLKFGRVVRPYLGIRLGPPSITSQMKVKGVMVLEVAPGGPAAAAGVTPTTR